MKFTWIALIFTITIFGCKNDDNAISIDPNKIQLNQHVHKKLSPELLKRIKKTTDVFQIIDGITYDKAVDLYKRDLNPEKNIIIFEEMVRVYKIFCKDRCTSHIERVDVYRALLLRSSYNSSEALSRLNRNILTEKEAKFIISQYKLKAEPIKVMIKN